MRRKEEEFNNGISNCIIRLQCDANGVGVANSVCTLVMILEGECADGQRACSLGADAAVREEHGSLVKLLCRRILLALEVQGALVQKAAIDERDKRNNSTTRVGSAWYASFVGSAGRGALPGSIALRAAEPSASG